MYQFQFNKLLTTQLLVNLSILKILFRSVNNLNQSNETRGMLKICNFSFSSLMTVGHVLKFKCFHDAIIYLHKVAWSETLCRQTLAIKV